jgi:hypothetical protein
MFANGTRLVREDQRKAMCGERHPGVTQPSTYANLRNSKTVILRQDEPLG